MFVETSPKFEDAFALFAMAMSYKPNVGFILCWALDGMSRTRSLQFTRHVSSLCFRETKHKPIRIPFTTTRRIPRYYVRVATPKINSVRFALTNGQRVTSDHHTYRMKPICVNGISTTYINKKCPLVTLGLQLTHNLISSFTCWVITQIK